MSSKRWYWVGLVVMATAAVAAPALARGPRRGWGPCGGGAGPCMAMAQRGPGPGAGRGMGGPGMGMGLGGINAEALESVAAEVGVDAATLAKIKTVVNNAHREAIDLRSEVARERLALRELLDAAEPDVKKVMKQMDAVGAAETRLRKNRVQLLLSVRELLTPEQRARVQAIMSERRPPRGGRGGWVDDLD